MTRDRSQGVSPCAGRRQGDECRMTGQTANQTRLVDVLTDVSIREGGQQSVDLRDADPAVKLGLLELIIKTGVRRVELTAFAPGPWFADSHELVKRASVAVPATVALRALYFNTQGLKELLGYPRLLREGMFHTAATSAYRRKNYRQRSPAHAREKMGRLLDDFTGYGLRFDTLLLSTAWGEPGAATGAEKVLAYLEGLFAFAAERGFAVQSLTLADTVGSAAPEAVASLIGAVKATWPGMTISAHLHPRPGSAEECIHAALDGGVDRWEAAWGGLGGSPYAEDPGGNIDIRSLINVYLNRGLDPGIDLSAVDPVVEFIRKHTRRRVAPINVGA